MRVLTTPYAPFLATADMEMDREKDGATLWAWDGLAFETNGNGRVPGRSAGGTRDSRRDGGPSTWRSGGPMERGGMEERRWKRRWTE